LTAQKNLLLLSIKQKKGAASHNRQYGRQGDYENAEWRNRPEIRSKRRFFL
jgi:hypothetical protein